MDYAWVGWLSSGLVGLGGLFVAWRAGSNQKQTALEVAEKQIRGQRETADRERRHRLLEASYLELLRDLATFNDWIYRVYPMATASIEAYTMPPMPPMPGAGRTDALLTAYWSTEIRALMKDWQEAIHAIYQTGIMIDFNRQQATEARAMHERYIPTDSEHATREMRLYDTLKPAANAAHEAVRIQIRRELLEE